MEKINLAKIHDEALEYELEILNSAEELTELRVKMCKHKDPKRLMYILPVLNCLMDEVSEYKLWIKEQLEVLGQDGG